MKKNEWPLLSVLIPVYNTSSYLKECLDSVVNQSYTNLQIICVNDGSTDDSGKILDEYQNRDNRVVVLHKKNSGIVGARKEAIRHAKGEYSVCIDSDDWIEKELLEDLMELALKNNADVVTSGCVREYGKGSSIDSDAIPSGTYIGENLHHSFHAQMMGKGICFQQNVKTTIWGKIYKTDLLRKYQMQADDCINVGEDSAVVYPCLLNARCIVVSGYNKYHYRVLPVSAAVTRHKDEEESLTALESILKKEFGRFENQIENMEYQSYAISLFNRLVICPESIVEIRNGVLYPFVGVKKTDRVLIYGAGRFGKRLYERMLEIGMDIVAIVDRNDGNGVVSVDSIHNYSYDKIIVAVLKNNIAIEICDNLKKMGINANSIVTIDCESLIAERM